MWLRGDAEIGEIGSGTNGADCEGAIRSIPGPSRRREIFWAAEGVLQNDAAPANVVNQ